MIPRTLVQTAESRSLPDEIVEARRAMMEGNPDWTFLLFDAGDREDFILDAFGAGMLATYRSIDERYGAARADLFRYLYIYEKGGVYIDVKSRFDQPISQAIGMGDDFIVSQWRNGQGDDFPSFGLHRELKHVPGGEFQQWHVIAKPRHPFLEAVVDAVARNVATYGVWRHGLGRTGVQRVTGPIAYTLAIAPMLPKVAHRRISSERDIGLRFSVLTRGMGRHYSEIRKPVVRGGMLGSVSASTYNLVRATRAALSSAAR